VKILLLEDNKDFVELIKLIYNNEKIFSFPSIREAHNWLATNKPGLILVDLGLEDSYGLNTLDELSKYKIPKVVVTANPNLAKQSAEKGAVDYILKNCDTSDILTRIGFNIEKYRKKQKSLFSQQAFEEIKASLNFSPEKLTQIA